MLCACIDIGSNTTRVLVAEAGPGGVDKVLQRREFTRIGAAMRKDKKIPKAKVREVAAVVAELGRLAEQVGCTRLRTVATAAIRDAANRDDLVTAIREASGQEVAILDAEQEARLAFLGATATLGRRPAGVVAVVDVGGGSTELAIGTVAYGVQWSTSVPLGSGAVTEELRRADPPSARDLQAIGEYAAAALAHLDIPMCDSAVAVGGSATSTRRLIGAVLEPDTVQRALRVLSGDPAAEVARGLGLDIERVRLLPAGILILDAVSHRLGHPLQIGRGGLREGVVLELAGASG
jgi:exopolyphosphatase/guanosine-5'-triphosphate,3'-diphosphate pyrophosphatase